MDDAIVVSNLGKHFRLNRARRPRRLKELFVRGLRDDEISGGFWALRNVSFAVPRGETFGIVGVNGAGKSTLLRLIGNVGAPDEGSARVNGRLGALLELGAGFSSELSGRENAIINGIVIGLTRLEVIERLPAIIAFAELQDFIDAPIRTYSSGMKLRLAFSVAIHSTPDILLVDEILAVGDIGFQQKCYARIAELKNGGCTLLLVSHDPTTVRRHCDRVLWLKHGQVTTIGPPDLVMAEMVASLSAETRQRTPINSTRKLPTGLELRTLDNRFGSLAAEVVDVQLLGVNRGLVTRIDSGESLVVMLTYRLHESIERAHFSVTLTRGDTKLLATHCLCGARQEMPLERQGRIALEIDRLELVDGQYFVDVGIFEEGWSYAYDFHWQVYTLEVRGAGTSEGVIAPPSRWVLAGTEANTLGSAGHPSQGPE